MPRDTSSIQAFEVSASEGSFVVRESSHNLHRFTHARDDAARPYPSAMDVYVRSHRPSATETFEDLGLNDFFIAHRRVARRRLERLDISPMNAELLSRGSLPQLERREPYDRVLEASIGYAAACSVAVMDEVAVVNERTTDLDERVVELNGRVCTLLDEVQELRRRNREFELALESERNLRRGVERRLASHIDLFDGLMGEVGAMRDDHARLVSRVIRGYPLRAEPMPQPLVEYDGRLVPIGMVDQPIDLTDDSDDIVPDSEGGEVVDLAEEEEAQARDARYRGELTFHAEVEAARADPSPEYERAPSYEPAPEYTESE
jgi:hypothetical protein